jgi:hypothetical protein
MRHRHFQFRLSTLLWGTLAVACWFGGMRFKQWLVDRRDAEMREAATRAIEFTWCRDRAALGELDVGS